MIAKLSDSKAEAGKTQSWLEFAVQCHYLDVESGRELCQGYNYTLATLISMIHNSDK